MRSRFDVVVSSILTICAVAIAGSVVYRTFAAPPVMQPGRMSAFYVDRWEEALEIGYPLTGHSKQVPGVATLVVVADLECPACRGFYSTEAELVAEYGDRLKVIHVSHPLDYHRFGRASAQAADCAEQLGSFKAFVDVVYAKQDSLGLKSWTSYASEAGIQDSTRIAQCATDQGVYPRIDAGLEYGRTIQLEGTPTVLLDGWRFAGVPSREEVRSKVDSVLQAKSAG